MRAITAVQPFKRISHCSCVRVYLLNLKVSLLAGRIKSGGGGVKETRPSLGVYTTDCVKVRITWLQSAEEGSLFNLHTHTLFTDIRSLFRALRQ